MAVLNSYEYHKFCEKYHNAGCYRYFEKVKAEPCRGDAGQKGGKSGPGALGGIHDGGKCHDRQSHIRHIMKK